MTREEDIFNASANAFNVCGDGFKEAIKLLWSEAFIAGAQWADEHYKNKWHLVDDVPIGQHDIICNDNEGRCWYCGWKYIYDNYLNWKEVVETMNVEKWICRSEL